MLRGVHDGRAKLLPAIAQFFCYFTVLTNLQAAIVATGAASKRGWRKPALEAATTVYIAVVGLGYSLLLRHLFDFTGLMRVADTLLHDVAPVLFASWWILAAQKADLPWRHVLTFLIWPLLYFALVLAIGAATHWYPYPFTNAAALGYPRVLAVAAGFIAAAAALSALAIGYSRIRARAA